MSMYQPAGTVEETDPGDAEKEAAPTSSGDNKEGKDVSDGDDDEEEGGDKNEARILADVPEDARTMLKVSGCGQYMGVVC